MHKLHVHLIAYKICRMDEFDGPRITLHNIALKWFFTRYARVCKSLILLHSLYIFAYAAKHWVESMLPLNMLR